MWVGWRGGGGGGGEEGVSGGLGLGWGGLGWWGRGRGGSKGLVIAHAQHSHTLPTHPHTHYTHSHTQDERSSRLEVYPFLQKVYLERILDRWGWLVAGGGYIHESRLIKN